MTLNFIVPAFYCKQCKSSTCMISSPSGAFRMDWISSVKVPTSFFSSQISTSPYLICRGVKNSKIVSCQDTDCSLVSFFLGVSKTSSPIVTLTETFISPIVLVFRRKVQFSNRKLTLSKPTSLKTAFKFIEPTGVFFCSMMTLTSCSTPDLLRMPSKSTIPQALMALLISESCNSIQMNRPLPLQRLLIQKVQIYLALTSFLMSLMEPVVMTWLETWILSKGFFMYLNYLADQQNQPPTTMSLRFPTLVYFFSIVLTSLLWLGVQPIYSDVQFQD